MNKDWGTQGYETLLYKDHDESIYFRYKVFFKTNNFLVKKHLLESKYNDHI